MRRRSLSERLATVAIRRPWRTIVVWLVVALACTATFGAFGGSLKASDDFVNQPESKKVEKLVAERFPGTDADTEIVVVSHPDMTAHDELFKQRVREIESAIRLVGADHVDGVFSYIDLEAAQTLQGLQPEPVPSASPGSQPDAAPADTPQDAPPKLISDDGHTAILLVTLAGAASEADQHMDGISAIVEQEDGRDGFAVMVTGSAAWEVQTHVLAESDLVRGEIVGIPIALIILIVVFGAVIAALVPVGLALVSIAIASAMTALIGQGFSISVFAINIITMMGLAVGIDYSLLIISRFREERATEHGRDEAVTRAAATAGRAVLFSGGTVVLALTGMLLVPFSIFTSLGVGSILVVIAAVAAALTLLPAVLHVLGDRIDWLTLPVRRRRPVAADGSPTGFWAVTARRIMYRPIISLLVGSAILLTLAIPMLHMHRGIPGAEQLPNGISAKRGFVILQRDFSVGLSSPILVTVEGSLDDPATVAGLAKMRSAIEADGRFTVLSSDTAPEGDLALYKIAVNMDASSDPAIRSVRDLRSGIIPPTLDGAPVKVMVGGVPGLYADSMSLIETYTPIVIAVVLTFSFILLLFAFRSLVIAAKAIFMNLLSVGAAYGATTYVFANGTLAGLFGFRQIDSIAAWLPLMMFCVLFGLSMDYQVFLLSRIREAYDRSGDTTAAVVSGVSSTAGIITGAALIMVAVFGGVATGELTMFQQLGFGLAVAVALDATIVRIVVVPSAMALLGKWNWYLPSWLEWLPRVSLEGETAANVTTVDDVATGDAGTGRPTPEP